MNDTQQSDYPRVVPLIDRPRRRERRLIVRELDDEALIYDAESANTHRLNATAYFVWRHCDGAHDPSAIARRMCEVYDVDMESAMGHVTRILTEFAEHRLVTGPP